MMKEVEIIDYDYNAKGIAKEDKVCFVPFSIIGEKLKVNIIKENKNFSQAQIVEVLEKNPERTKPPCPYFGECGGCQLQHMNYSASLKAKEIMIKNAFKKYYKEEVFLEPFIQGQSYSYRNKFNLPINYEEKKLGMFTEEKIISINNCLLLGKWAEPLFEIFNCYFNKLNKKDLFNIKRVMARFLKNTLLITLICKTKPNNIQILIDLLKEKYLKFGLGYSLSNTAVIKPPIIPLFGEDKIELDEFGIKYNIDNLSFLQINNEVKEKLYLEVQKHVNNAKVVDAFCGAGLLSAIMAKSAQHVTGIEIVESSINSAKKLKEENKISNLDFILGDCGKTLLNIKSFDTLVLDPTKKGCDNNVIESIKKNKPKKIVYISCNPNSQALDLFKIKEFYTIDKIQPFDMFPQTANVENLIILKLKS